MRSTRGITMSKKFIAILAVLLIVATPFAILGCSEGAAVSNDDTPLDLDKVKGVDTYWVKATFSEKTVTLSNTDKDVGGVLELKTSDKNVEKVVIADGFKVPAGKGIACGNDEGGLMLTVDRDFTVSGSINGNMQVTNGAKITFSGAVIGCDGVCRIYVGDKAKFDFVNQSVIGILKMMDYDGKYAGISMANVIAIELNVIYIHYSGEKDIPNSWSLKGSLTKYINGLDAALMLGQDGTDHKNDDSFILNDLMLSNLEIILNNECTNILAIRNSNNVIDLSSCKIVGDSAKALQLLRVMGGDDRAYTLIFNYYEDYADEDGKLVFVDVKKDAENPVSAYYELLISATDGIASISQQLNKVSITEGTIDLTKIEVTCEPGYKFAGWYYMDKNGVLCKFLDPAHFPVANTDKVYAVAEKISPTIPEQKDYTGYLIGAIVVLVLILLAIGIFHYMPKKN